MRRLAQTLRKLIRSDEALSTSEYAVMLALIACLCMGPIQTLGCQANRAFTNTSNAMGR